MNIGGAPLNAVNPMQPYQSSKPTPSSSFAPNVVPSLAPTPQAPSLPLSAPSAPIPLRGAVDPNANSIHIANTNLVKPSSFFVPPSTSSPLMLPTVSSSMPTVATLHAPQNLQRPYGTPLLQPFPPPAPPASLTPTSSPQGANERTIITRDKVRDALLMLVQVSLFLLSGVYPCVDYWFCMLTKYTKLDVPNEHYKHTRK